MPVFILYGKHSRNDSNISIGSYNSKLWQCSWASSSRQSTNLCLSPPSPFFRGFLGSEAKLTCLHLFYTWFGDGEVARQNWTGMMTIYCTIIYQILSWPSKALSIDNINCPQSLCSHIPQISLQWIPTFSVGCFLVITRKAIKGLLFLHWKPLLCQNDEKGSWHNAGLQYISFLHACSSSA